MIETSRNDLPPKPGGLRKAAATAPARRRRRRRWLIAGVSAIVAGAIFTAGGLLLDWAFPFPFDRLARWPASPIVTDRNGELLLRVVSRQEEWRVPVPLKEMSSWLPQAAVAAEDERFWLHPGVDPLAVLRAAWQNLRAGEVISGASTLTMQICRMMEDRPRTWSAKLVESFQALQLEQRADKAEILEIYLNLIPCGGNLRGVESASRMYFGKRSRDLSLEEAALIVGLAQAPSRYRPDRHVEAARARRNHVLRRMHSLGMIDANQLAIAVAAPVRLTSAPANEVGLHAAWMALQRRGSGGRTTIDRALQVRVEEAAIAHATALPVGSQVAVVVLDISSGDILALVGSLAHDDPRQGQVNAVIARRSPGSTLKPFVYAAAFEAGRLSPDALVYDVPIQRTGWVPDNFDRHYRGLLTAAEALRRSLNVPAILVLEGVGLRRCLGVMEAAGLRLPPHASRRAGLSVVVGTAEVSLLELTAAYAALGHAGVYRPPRIFLDEPSAATPALSEPACAAVNDILSTRHRRPQGVEPLDPRGLPWFMWKTGTSSGRRDAWAVGHNHRVAVGVWVGRFNGLGNARFVGTEVAEPLLARLFLMPELRQEDDPPPPPILVAQRPLPPPPEYRLWADGTHAEPPGPALELTEPRDGATFIAVAGTATILPKATIGDGVTWFLNGRFLPSAEAARLQLRPGAYELRCVAEGGQTVAVRFRVRGA